MSSEPPSLLLDVSRLLWRSWRRQLPTGIDRACLAYVAHFRDRALAVVQRGGMTRVLNAADSRTVFDLLLDPGPDIRSRILRALLPALALRGVGEQGLKGAVYLNIGHTGLDRRGHGRWVDRTGVRAIYYVHDLIPITHPQFARSGHPERHAERMHTVLRHAAGVLGNSRDSLRALEEFAARESLTMPPSLRVPLAAEAIRGTGEGASPPPIPEPYFVMLGTIEGRKNHALLLDVWRALIREGGGVVPKLVIIGQRGWCADDVFVALDGDSLLRPHVLELGRCGDGELADWLVHARALLFPSFVEGQGLPLIEALAVGTPVVASDLDVFRETGGDVPDYLSPDDIAGWEAIVRDYARPESAGRAAQLERMRGFTVPTWARHFEAVERWIGGLKG